MKNLNKLNPEARVILSDSEMKEISGGLIINSDGCFQTGTYQCSEGACTKNGYVGNCWYILGEGGGCQCIIRELV